MRARLTICLLLLAPSASAYQNEPTGFRGIEWGTPIQKLRSSLVLDGDPMENGDGEMFYLRPADQLSLGKSILTSIRYVFYKGKFSGTMLEGAKAAHNCWEFTEAFVERFGESYENSSIDGSFTWFGKTTTVNVYNGGIDNPTCYAMYFSRRFQDLQAADKNRKSGNDF